jgi:hypothetical protein
LHRDPVKRVSQTGQYSIGSRSSFGSDSSGLGDASFELILEATIMSLWDRQRQQRFHYCQGGKCNGPRL